MLIPSQCKYFGDDKTHQSRQCVEAIQEEPKLKCSKGAEVRMNLMVAHPRNGSLK